MDKHADPLDKASEIAQMYADHGLQAVQRKVKPEQVQNEDGTWPHLECVDCSVEIPEQRLALGKVRCIDCQEIIERRASAYR